MEENTTLKDYLEDENIDRIVQKAIKEVMSPEIGINHQVRPNNQSFMAFALQGAKIIDDETAKGLQQLVRSVGNKNEQFANA